MTADEVRELLAYNAWANRKFFDALASLPEEQYHRDLQSSFGGIHGTLAHIVWAEQLWLHRLLGKPAPATPQGRDLATLADVRARWESVEAERGGFLAGLRDADLTATRSVQPTTGGAYVHSLRQIFRHVVDHSSYHRGQIVTLLRQLGVKPPASGLMFYYRERGLTL